MSVEIDGLAGNYIKAREAKQAASEDEKDARELLITAMRRDGVKTVVAAGHAITLQTQDSLKVA